MEVESGPARGRWGTAVALTLAVVFLAVFDAVPLVAVPLALLLMAAPAPQRWKWMLVGLVIWMVGMLLPTGEVGALGRTWALLLGAFFLAVTMTRRWGVFPRALTALAATLAAAVAWLLVTGQGESVDALLRQHFHTVSTMAVGDLAARAPESGFLRDLSAATDRMAVLQWTLFPAILALQSLAALALASWWFARLRGVADTTLGLRPLRQFRFNDQLVWLVVAGLALLLVPAGELATRIGWNVLLFMGSLYALRGAGVFVFLAGGAPSWFAIVFGALALLFLYPVVLTAAVLVGLGDTWLDVRGRAAAPPPTDA